MHMTTKQRRRQDDTIRLDTKRDGTTRQYKAIQRRVNTTCLMIYINEGITD